MPAPLAPSPSGRASRLELQSAPGVEGGAASARRRWAGTGRVLALLLSAAARQLQLTSPKFPAPAPLRPFRRARFVVCARVCAEPGAPLSEFLRTKPSRRGGEGARGGNLRKPRSHLTSRVLAGAAPASPTPAARWAPSGPGCHSAAPEVAGALLPGSGLGEWRARSASRSLHTVWRWQPWCHPGYPGLSEQRWWRLWDSLPGGPKRAAGRVPCELRRKRGRTLENVGDIS
uniref:Uncharacterized protein n=1 Tax=Rousettus aegyptiacus TaxID=9407 RepID=A0A7J8DXY6_ROUAE|nr:hypothetical protein HJG63_008400 [Rousettus aegyptiacus]